MRFGGEKVYLEGIIELPKTFGEEPRVVTKMVNFLGVDCSSTYDAILERLNFHELREIPSTYHQIIRFSIIKGVGMIKREQKM